ncbi:uncharacterized protein LOC136027304 isoform X2 [Artemia franciscana]|uniref:uncharacterized protein LOC136027304 isoform X2 n=1 Tax=Artemia franciscana TaxID=6661 RepID=UPI0032DB8ADF
MSEPDRVDNKHWRGRKERRYSSERGSTLNYSSPPISYTTSASSVLPPPVGLELVNCSENEVFTSSYVPSPEPTIENYSGWQRTSFSVRDASNLCDPVWNYRPNMPRNLTGEVDHQLDPPEGFGNDPTWSPKARGERSKNDRLSSLSDDRKCTCGQRMRLGTTKVNSLHSSRNSLDDLLHPRFQVEDINHHLTPVHAYGTISRSHRRNTYDRPKIDHALLDYNAQEKIYSDPAKLRLQDGSLRSPFGKYPERNIYGSSGQASPHSQNQRDRLRLYSEPETAKVSKASDTYVAAKATTLTRTPCPCLLAAMSVVRQDDSTNPSVYAHVEGCPHCGGTHTTKINSDWSTGIQNIPVQSTPEVLPYKNQPLSSNSSSGSEVGGSQTLRGENVLSSKQSLLPIQRRTETSSVYSSLPRSRMASLSTVPLSNSESRPELPPQNVQATKGQPPLRPSSPTPVLRNLSGEAKLSKSVGEIIANAALEAKELTPLMAPVHSNIQL